MSVSHRAPTTGLFFRSVVIDPRVGDVPEVTRPKHRSFSARREIVAVIEPAWAEGDDTVTASARAPQHVVAEAAEQLVRHLKPGEVVAPTADGKLALRLRFDDRAARPVRLQEMAYHCLEALESTGYRMGLVDLGVGWSLVTRKKDGEKALEEATVAAHESRRQRDHVPRHLSPEGGARVTWWSSTTQLVLATIGSVLAPFFAMVLLYWSGIDVAGPLYWVLVGALALTALTIWAESFFALDPEQPPSTEGKPAPRATAVIAAYLPNEADTILDTLRAFLAQEYSGGLQIVLAYNTPTPMAVESELLDLAGRHRDLTVVKVEDSTSKAQNVNAALRVAEGEFIGIFDADHHPMQGAFERAWAWIADGADVVQGHCVIRNGEDSTLAKVVAVEFEQIYAASHPGRAVLHGFGIFGGSNGYWRADALEQIRLRGSFLTEDIEASMRLLSSGGRIVNDPGLVSYELAPESLKALWKQRMRWAQGWFQVSLRYVGHLAGSRNLSLRQRIGATYLLGWRELYPWITLMVFPLLMFLAYRDGGIDLGSPLFVLVTLFVLVSGPLQTLMAYRLAAPEIRRHGWWFLLGALSNLAWYSEWKNLVNRVAHLKQFRGEHQWVVTPRSAATTGSHATERTREVRA